MALPCDNEQDGQFGILLRTVRDQRGQIESLTTQRDALLAVCNRVLRTGMSPATIEVIGNAIALCPTPKG